MRQCTLSTTGQLALVKPVSVGQIPLPSPQSTFHHLPSLRPPHLPTEVLVKILESFADDTTWRPCQYLWDACLRDDFWDIDMCRGAWPKEGTSQQPLDLLSSMLTCQKFKKILEPMLYRFVSVTNYSESGIRSRRRLLQTMKARPELCRYVQNFEFIIYDAETIPWSVAFRHNVNEVEEDIEAALALLSRLNPKEVFLQGRWRKPIDNRFFSALNKFEIQILRASLSWGHSIFHYLRQGSCSSLKQLFLFSCYNGSSSATDERRLRRPTLEQIPTDREFSVGVETFEVTGGDSTANELHYICRFIMALKVFKLRCVPPDRCPTYTEANMQRMLDLHQQSLEIIELPIYINEWPKIPNFSRYTSLKRLFLFWGNLVRDTPLNAMAKLAAPWLEHLTIQMDYDLSYGISVFEKNEAQWLTTMVSNHEVHSRLKHIHIILEWGETDEPCWCGGEPDSPWYLWPYHHLKLLKPALEVSGITLTWNEPHVSEERWKNTLMQTKQVREEELEQDLQHYFGNEVTSEEYELEFESRCRLLAIDAAEQHRRGRVNHYFPYAE